MNSYNGFEPKQRYAALSWLKKEYEDGRRTPPVKCDVCGQTEGHIEAHSEDYSAPFGDHIGEFGLCYPCHMVIHCRFRNPRAWKWYRENIRKGGRILMPYHGRFWHRFCREILSAEPEAKWTFGDPPERLILDEIELGRSI